MKLRIVPILNELKHEGLKVVDFMPVANAFPYADLRDHDIDEYTPPYLSYAHPEVSFTNYAYRTKIYFTSYASGFHVHEKTGRVGINTFRPGRQYTIL